MERLFTDDLVSEMEEFPTPHSSFLVNLCTRQESAIQNFRGQLDNWFDHLQEEVKASYRERQGEGADEGNMAHRGSSEIT